MLWWRITFCLGWMLSIASADDSSGIKAKRDANDPLLIHISGHGFGFENQFLTDEQALEKAPPETANDPKTPGTITKRDREAARDVDIKWTRSHSSIKFTVRNPIGVIGASVSFPDKETFYGVWEYGFDQAISNKNTTYDVKGLYGLKHPGTDWASGRTPFFFTRSGLGFYIDTPKIGRFRFSEEDRQVTFAFNSTEIDYYVFKASEPAKLLEQYAKLSNTAGFPPNSGYGPIFWNNDWNTHWPEGVTNAEENYYDVADHLQENQIRATAMFADRPYGTGNYSYGNFDFDPVFYPDVEKFVSNMTSRGYELQAWIANRAPPLTESFNVSVENEWLFPGIDANFFEGGPALNLSIPEAYNWYLERLKYFARIGIKGYKIDRGEEHEMPDAEQNIQNELFVDIAYKSMKEIHGEGNFFIFARSVFDRSRSKTAIWDGDTNSSWESLRISVLSAIRSGLIGFSQWGSDTGGYVRPGTAPNDELWARWMMFSAFSPMYEIQIGRGKSPWYPPYGNTTMHNLKVSTDLHTRLFPFLRSYAKVASKSGVPVLRALFLEYPNDPKVDVIGDQYAFGEEFLVAPIVGTGSSRNVYFPAGERYLEWFNKTTVYEGGQNVTVRANLDEIPAFVREGSIIPTGDIHQGNAKWIEDWKPHVEIEVFPGYHVKHSSFSYYGNDGKTSKITVKTDAQKKRVTIEHESFDVPATFLVYGKNAEDGPLRLDARKSKITLKNFASLFD